MIYRIYVALFETFFYFRSITMDKTDKMEVLEHLNKKVNRLAELNGFWSAITSQVQPVSVHEEHVNTEEKGSVRIDSEVELGQFFVRYSGNGWYSYKEYPYCNETGGNPPDYFNVTMEISEIEVYKDEDEYTLTQKEKNQMEELILKKLQA